jgi:hypothetical protein
MDAQTIAVLVAGGGALGVVVWLLAKLGRVLIKVAEALAAAAVVLVTVWILINALVWALRPGGHPLADQPGPGGACGVVALVEPRLAGDHCGRGRRDAPRVAAA